MGYKAIRNALLAMGLVLGSNGLMAQGMASAEMLSGSCAGCHGGGGNSDGPATPGIAGMSKGYFIAAMLAYKYGGDEAAVEAAIKANPSVLDADEFEVLPRTGTIMGRIAKGYSEDEIFAMADYFAKQGFVRHPQTADSALASKGANVHEKNCEKCHEDGGRTSVDDVGILAGQWMPYLSNAMADFRAGDRKMPKKMAAKVKDLGDDDFKALIQYYGSQQK
ncbi:MAG TPA: c-type cytochrome [Gammaproteobacteria bacterium]